MIRLGITTEYKKNIWATFILGAQTMERREFNTLKQCNLASRFFLFSENIERTFWKTYLNLWSLTDHLRLQLNARPFAMAISKLTLNFLGFC